MIDKYAGIRPSAISVLRMARDIIKFRREEFVCFAIKEAARELNIPGIGFLLVADIEKRIAPYNTVSSWLIETAKVKSAEVFTYAYAEKDFRLLREYRLRWIDDMIATLEAGGDL